MAQPGATWVEIVGLAGTGKSTLARTLVERHPDWRIAESIHARAPGHLPYFVHAAPGLARLAAHSLRRPRVSWDEAKAYVYASEWRRYLQARPEHGSGVTLFDQGPLFALARLLWGGAAVLRSSWFRAWQRDTTAGWGLALDAVVELTAPDDVLLERINRRGKPHAAKGSAEADAAAVLASHRRAYDAVLADVADTGSARLLRFDTSERTLEDIAEQISGRLARRASDPLDGAPPRAQRTSGVTHARVRDEIGRLGSIG